MKLTIKRVQVQDIGALRSMALDFLEEFESKLAYPGMNTAEVDEHMMEILANIDSPDSIYLIAYDGKRPAGYVTGWIGNKPYSQPRRVSVAQEIYVVPEKRSGIVGLKLMEESAKIAVQRGAQAFECIGTMERDAEGKLKGSFERWEKFGFKPYVVYGVMPTEDFLAVTKRFTRSAAA